MGALATLGLIAGIATAQAQEGDMSFEAIAERLKPVGELCLQGDDCGAGTAQVSVDVGGAKSGEEVFTQVCAACHTTGAAGAPIRGKAEDWTARLEKGMDTLYVHAIEGFNAMPAMGGNPSLTEREVKNAVNYMTEPVRGDDVAIDTGESEAAAAAPAEDAAAPAQAEGTGQVAAAEPAIDGAAIYGQICMACHDTGAAGAPKRGDDNAWEPRLAKGIETLYDHAIHGFNAMPPKGGNPALSDAEVKAAVDHLIETVQ
ncbi:MAG: c-type cytochrome [Halomonas sp.]|nr:c-type cytochrome [Halomonas sp.]